VTLHSVDKVWIDLCLVGTVDSLAGNSTYSGVINTVFNGQQDYLTNGQSYDDVQWVAIAYLQAGQQDEAKKYYDIASTAVDSTYCGGGRASFHNYLCLYDLNGEF
jgi:hypothetical protein